MDVYAKCLPVLYGEEGSSEGDTLPLQMKTLCDHFDQSDSKDLVENKGYCDDSEGRGAAKLLCSAHNLP